MIPFTYTCDRSIEVYKKTKEFIQKHLYEDKITNLGWVYHSICEVIPHTIQNLGSGHYFPILDSWHELQVSTNLSLFGFYKQSMTSLRSGLELGLLSIYWNIDDKGHISVKNWLKSNEDTPRLNDIWKVLIKNRNINIFQTKYDIKTRLLNLNYLSNYVHSKGHRYSNIIGLAKPNLQTFEEKGFINWLKAFEEVIIVLSTLHLLKYPIAVIKYDYFSKFGIDRPSFGGLTLSQIERIEKLIGNEYFKSLENIALSDDNVQAMIQHLNNLPDLTQEDIDEQIIDFDKSQIPYYGFIKWYELEIKDLPDSVTNSPKWQRRINILKQWAIENGFYEIGLHNS